MTRLGIVRGAEHWRQLSRRALVPTKINLATPHTGAALLQATLGE
jgi:hypothetical protein